jgi:hypothetical protein
MTNRFDQPNLLRGGEGEESPSFDEKRKAKIADYFFGFDQSKFDPKNPQTLEEKLIAGTLSPSDFNQALERAKTWNILRSISAEKAKQLKAEEEKDKRARGGDYLLRVIESLPEKDGQPIKYYAFKFFSGKLAFQTLERQVFERLAELRNQILELEVKRVEKRIAEKRQAEMLRYFESRLKAVEAGNYNRNTFHCDLEMAIKNGLIKEITEQELNEINKQRKEKSKEPVQVIKFYEWERPAGSGWIKEGTRRIRFFVYSGPFDSGISKACFQILKDLLKAILKREREKAEQRRAKEGEAQRKVKVLQQKAWKEVQKIGGPQMPLPSKKPWKEQLEEVFRSRGEEERESFRQSDKIERKRARAERKQKRQEILESLRRFGLTEQDIQEVLNCADMRIKPEKVEELRKFLINKGVPEERVESIFTTFKIEVGE